MYVNTDKKYLYYFFENRYYKVPTFGKLYKIIDFGRAIYEFNGVRYCSDSFAPNGDAHTQYNCEPFYNPNKARIEPNMSFDLCRLGASIYDFIIDDNDEDHLMKMDILQQTIYNWCHDDNGKNVLYKRDGSERYPNFSLYKMLSRTVHNHIPRNELINNELFTQYVISDKKKIKEILLKQSDKILNVDKIPNYWEEFSREEITK